MHRVDRSKLSVKESTLEGTIFDFGEHKNMNISLLGSYQPLNASTVLSALDILRERGMSIPESAIREGLAAARWQARFEIISRDPLTIFDGAHNAEGIAAAVKSIKTYFADQKVYVLSGVLSDKDYRAIAKDISSVASRAFTMTPDNPRALAAEDYAAVLRENGVDANAYPSIDDALTAALDAARNEGKALVCLGSLYTYCSIIDKFDV
jgi:dihydrofolate synthase/folylpolyglutamate synthase